MTTCTVARPARAAHRRARTRRPLILLAALLALLVGAPAGHTATIPMDGLIGYAQLAGYKPVVSGNQVFWSKAGQVVRSDLSGSVVGSPYAQANIEGDFLESDGSGGVWAAGHGTIYHLSSSLGGVASWSSGDLNDFAEPMALVGDTLWAQTFKHGAIVRLRHDGSGAIVQDADIPWSGSPSPALAPVDGGVWAADISSGSWRIRRFTTAGDSAGADIALAGPVYHIVQVGGFVAVAAGTDAQEHYGVSIYTKDGVLRGTMWFRFPVNGFVSDGTYLWLTAAQEGGVFRVDPSSVTSDPTTASIDTVTGAVAGYDLLAFDGTRMWMRGFQRSYRFGVPRPTRTPLPDLLKIPAHGSMIPVVSGQQVIWAGDGQVLRTNFEGQPLSGGLGLYSTGPVPIVPDGDWGAWLWYPDGLEFRHQDSALRGSPGITPNAANVQDPLSAMAHVGDGLWLATDGLGAIGRWRWDTYAKKVIRDPDIPLAGVQSIIPVTGGAWVVYQKPDSTYAIRRFDASGAQIGTDIPTTLQRPLGAEVGAYVVLGSAGGFVDVYTKGGVLRGEVQNDGVAGLVGDGTHVWVSTRDPVTDAGVVQEIDPATVVGTPATGASIVEYDGPDGRLPKRLAFDGGHIFVEVDHTGAEEDAGYRFDPFVGLPGFHLPARWPARKPLPILVAYGRAAGFQVTITNALGIQSPTDPCTPQQTTVTAHFPLPGKYRIQLASAILDTPVTSTTVTVPGPTPPAGASSTFAPYITCSGDTDISSYGGPGAKCATSASVGIAVAVGCFTTVDSASQVGPHEQPIIQYLTDAFAKLPWWQRLLAQQTSAPCHRALLVTCADDTAIHSTNMLVSKGIVRLSGLDITPIGGSTIVLIPWLQRIICWHCIVRAGDTILGSARSDYVYVDWDLHSTYTTRYGFSTLASDLVPRSSLPTVGGLKVTGGATATVEIGNDRDGEATRVNLPLQLPPFFSGASGTPTVTYRGDDTGGYPDLVAGGRAKRGPLGSALPQRITLDSLTLPGGIKLSGVSGEYDPVADKWHFEAGFDFLGVGIHMARSDSLPYGGITLDGGGGLESAGAELALNPPKPILGPLSLDRVGFSFEFNPITVINGNLKLSALEIIHFDGTMIGAWPDATHPYWFPQDGKWHDAGTHPFYDPVFGVNVGVSIDLPGAIGTQDLADGWVVFDSGGYLDIGGGISFRVLGFARVHGGIEGVFNFPDGKYMIDGSVDGAIFGYDVVGAQVRVSNAGVVVCAHLLGADPGVAVLSPSGKVILWYGVAGSDCDVNRVHVDITPPAVGVGRRRAQPLQVQIAAGTRARTIQLDGTTAAPQVVVTGPDGETVQSGGTTDTAHLHVFSSTDDKVTAVGIVGAPPGTYTIALLPGSSAVTTATQSDAPAALQLTASTATPARRPAAAGATTRTLRWHVNARPQQTITFTERGPGIVRTLLTTSKTSGALRYTPTIGASRSRRVEAQIFLGGLPSGGPHVISRYQAAPATRPGRVARLRAAWRRRVLVVRWAGARNATGYRIDVTTTTGAHLHAQVGGRARTLTLRRAPRTAAGTIRITPIGALGRTARPTTARYRRLVAPHQGALPWSELTSHH